jgi:GNAT superfamily N-acetyltransferase
MSSSNLSEITLHVSPLPSEFFRQTAIMQCLAFADSTISRWWSPTPKDAELNTVDDIQSFRLSRVTRDHKHRELQPGVIVVCAVIDNQAVGCAAWRPPKRLWKSETLAEMLYRKVIESKDALEDWLFPSWWYILPRRAELERLQLECMDKFLGLKAIDEMWYLKILCVHPGFQRRGIGAILLDWGLNHARERGEKVYLEASHYGKGLYAKKGFKDVGNLIAGENNEVVLPCMLWDPKTAPNQT